MRSLRSRLILGVSLLTLIPLAVTLVLLTNRVQAIVRHDAAERLDRALGEVRGEVASTGQQVSEKLRILSGDPELKRLFLLRPGSRELADYVAERQFLLGLDFLSVADTNGANISASATPGKQSPDSTIHVDPHGDLATERIEALADGRTLGIAAGAPIRYRNDIAGIVRGGLVLDAGLLTRLGGSGGIELALRDNQDHVLASTLASTADNLPARTERTEVGGRSYLVRSVPLEITDPLGIQLAGLASTDSADRILTSVRIASAFLAILGLAIAILLGVLWSSQVSGPVERIAAFSDRLARGEWDEPLSVPSVRELDTLVDSLDRMRRDLRAYRERIAVSERQAAWGQMARKVAHEIKNPLTPIAISVADLRRSYEAKRPDFPEILEQASRTIAEEVEALRRILQEFSDFARFPAPVFTPESAASLLTDLESLYGREIGDGRLRVSRPQPDLILMWDRAQMRQALINLVQNGLEAVGTGEPVEVEARRSGDVFEIAVRTPGPGLTPEQRANLFVPGFTTKPHGSGLGLTIVERIVNEHGGVVAVDSEPGIGTTFRIRIPVERKRAA